MSAAPEPPRADALPQRLPVGDAVRRVLADARPLPAEEVALAAALGRVLADDVVAPLALPPWDNASMDGWAVRAADVLGASAAAPTRLQVVAVAAAGAPTARAVGAGEAVRIATGAPLPAGADAVVRVEDSRPDGDDARRVQIVDDRDAREGRRNVRPRGEDVAAGEAAVRAGDALGAGHLALLAALGRGRVAVVRRPRVAIVGSGDELVPPAAFDAVRAGRAIVATNGVALAALAERCGAEATDLGTTADDADALAARMADALAGGCDLLLSTGGVSVGDRDHARDAFARVGGVLRFWRVRMRPGGPLAYGVARLPAAGGVPARDVPWLGLPGNPVSAMVTFELFARPLLLRLAGRTHVHRRPVPVLLDEPVSTAAPLTHFLRAVVHRDAAGALRARLAGPQGSGLLTSMARADALLVVPDDVRDVPAGATLSALSLTAALPDGGGAGLDELTAEWPL